MRPKRGEKTSYRHYEWKMPPYRCSECKYYSECLGYAARRDLSLDCTDCKHCTPLPRYMGISEEEVYNCCNLLSAIFFPEKYKTYVLQKKTPPAASENPELTKINWAT